jgi:hypothetical protein
MKNVSLYATVAFLCCGSTSLFAQAYGWKEAQNRSPQAVSPSASGLQPAAEQIPDPFQFLDNPQEPASTPAKTDSSRSPVLIAPQTKSGESSDPASLPVSRPYSSNNAVVDTMVHQGVIASVPHAATSPVEWCYGELRAPNHVADFLMRQECVEGLWDRYPAQRAAECAHMWEKLTATKQCHCGHGCGSCNANYSHSGSVNRYTQSQCDGCAHCAATANAQALNQAAQMAAVKPETSLR